MTRMSLQVLMILILRNLSQQSPHCKQGKVQCRNGKEENLHFGPESENKNKDYNLVSL